MSPEGCTDDVVYEGVLLAGLPLAPMSSIKGSLQLDYTPRITWHTRIGKGDKFACNRFQP